MSDLLIWWTTQDKRFSGNLSALSVVLCLSLNFLHLSAKIEQLAPNETLFSVPAAKNEHITSTETSIR